MSVLWESRNMCSLKPSFAGERPRGWGSKAEFEVRMQGNDGASTVQLAWGYKEGEEVCCHRAFPPG
ncbi:transmembrane protein 106A, isoform CRA_b [Rattus norvegicus]|uniref:Transmembrane protein 106A, isoform CRA_b n=1 Tax=Rattus norvegicus TaxID=10116 RepID=A6HJD8_RAT|nr:transmembrane protein 106A, isoform CRA_b [Rattus norvegicus]